MPIRRFGPLLALVAFAGSAPAAEFSSRVIGITDGDTITVLKDRSPVKIRLHGIDCPKAGQDFGSRAKAFTSEIAFGQVVTVRPVTIDRYRRTVAEVVLDGRMLDHEILRAGLAWWYRRYAAGDRYLERFERDARDARRGLWSQPNPIPPWEWRNPKSNRVPAAAEVAVIANRRGFVHHHHRCPNAGRISPKNRVTFPSPAAAERAGYRPAKDCH